MSKNEYEYDTTQITDADVVKRIQNAVKIDIDRRKAMNAPIAVYDPDTGNVYAEYGDGKRILMGSKIKRGSYSEQE